MIFDISKRQVVARTFLKAGALLVVSLLVGVNFSPAHADDAATNAPTAAPAGTNAPPGQGPATNAPAAATSGEVADLPTAGLLFRQGKQDEALVVLNQVLQKEPQNINALMLRGGIYTLKQQWDPAAKDFQLILQVDASNGEAKFNLADLKFRQHQFDDARTAFVALPESTDDDVRDLTKYKIFLCDLLGGHEEVAAKELEGLDQKVERASYYFGNAAWSLVHKKPEEARAWIMSAANIYPPRKHVLYMTILKDMGYLPLPPPPPAQ